MTNLSNVIIRDFTDIVLLRKGESVIQYIRRPENHELFRDPVPFQKFLEINNLWIPEIFLPLKADTVLVCFNPDIYRGENEHRLFGSHRMRSLEYFNHLCTGLRTSVTDFLLELKGRAIDVLEIGPGSGRLILDLLKLVPDANIRGISKYEGEDDFFGSVSLYRVASLLRYEFCETLLQRPKFTFKNLVDGKLDMIEDSSLDLIISQATIRYIERKEILVQEVFRVLRPGGRAFLQIHFMRIAGTDLNKFFKQGHFESQFEINDFGVLLIEKKWKTPLSLELSYLPGQSRFNEWQPTEDPDKLVGWHSTYSMGSS